MEKIAPLMIVMTPVRNEAWVLRLFLTVTSRWADHIVIADQMSTDGSREIAGSFPKVTLIDNNVSEFNEADRQAMLISKAREIAAGRDCILWGLDADEIFDAHFMETKDWEEIENSNPGDVFFFKWAEICPDRKHYWLSRKIYFPWMFHDDGKEPHGNYVRKMHSMRIPYPIEERQLHYVDDFRVLHFAYVNPSRVASKRRFYTFVDWELNHRDPVTLERSYAFTKEDDEVLPLDEALCYSADKDGVDMWSMVDLKSPVTWMDDYIAGRIDEKDLKQLRKLSIWDENSMKERGIRDPRRPIDRMIHRYLAVTGHIKDLLPIRCVDRLLKLLY
ncbi:MAG: glycosyltransferase family 2 protein [Bacteroidales bacterium]|nr:glycosyltransferase family 2 protein [Bacteroidales bacterium]